MNTLLFVIPTIIQLYIFVLLLRVWLQWTRADFYNPLSLFVVKVTQPILGPMRRVIPAMGPIDTSTVLMAFIFTIVNIIFGMWATSTLALLGVKVIPIAIILLLTYAGKLVFWLILVRTILSWVSQGRNPIDHLLYQLTEPLMSPIRRIIPAMGGLDFSAMIIMFILIALNSLRMEVAVAIDTTITAILYSIGIM